MESPNRENSDEVEEIPSIEAMQKRLKAMEKTFADFRIIGDGTINFSGDMKKGFNASLDL